MKTNSQLIQLGLLLGPLLLAVLCGVGTFWAAGGFGSNDTATQVVTAPTLRPTATSILPSSTPTPINTTTPTPTVTNTPTATPTDTPTSTPTPTPTIPPTPIVTPGPIRDLGRLITADQDYQVWLIYEDKPKWWPFPFWNNKIILFTVGWVEAGIDLNKLRDEDLKVFATNVQITLPPPEIFGDPNLDLEQTVALEGSSFNPISMDWNEMISAQKDAETAILKKAGETKLLEKARQNAETKVELLLRRLGATDVTINWRDVAK